MSKNNTNQTEDRIATILFIFVIPILILIHVVCGMHGDTKWVILFAILYAIANLVFSKIIMEKNKVWFFFAMEALTLIAYGIGWGIKAILSFF